MTIKISMETNFYKNDPNRNNLLKTVINQPIDDISIDEITVERLFGCVESRRIPDEYSNEIDFIYHPYDALSKEVYSYFNRKHLNLTNGHHVINNELITLPEPYYDTDIFENNPGFIGNDTVDSILEKMCDLLELSGYKFDKKSILATKHYPRNKIQVVYNHDFIDSFQIRLSYISYEKLTH